ncbi:transcriptional regulator family: Fungal Specific TF [Penicillium roqueforti]|uniref:Tachykinin family protein n=1 Tax=Penicillium roqueforti (strain FM164) TaxID=1365484 RepID=W6QP26_PENRF|nr:transcriptional regulator family: Fungal Specific TF [Penicillium roqueforti]CDM38170.1 hypothetical protein PROQFM164_S09g000086 [Penicillium roqueforti FM164]KAF9241424.1 transcriptional regulator family: Fungal Specific TF [Penicillium roqueforti]KAI1830394.1 transcriptional regulator family: Fungal Specific TF [Penicillium roqueforti]KAI2670920.1 transcriptional regulator family: Fungal Specific TF [Penicillium roqueforti]KAI2674599.1 transcriptional regulator family: Fungal Specific TF
MSSRKKQKKDSIHFVNARPASETERLKAQRLVRAHVGRWISETKDRSAGESSSSRIRPVRALPAVAHAGPGPGPGPSYTLVSRPSSSHRGSNPGQFTFAHNSRSNQAAYRDSPFPPSQASDSSDSSSSDDASTVTTFSSEALAVIRFNDRSSPERLERNLSGVFDPFATYPAPKSFEPEMINLSERYLTGVVWPGLAPRPLNVRAAANKWFDLSMADPALFTAFMFGSLCHLRVQWQNNWVPGTVFGQRERRALQLCEMESIKLINQAVRDPDRAVSDAVLLSVICMAHHQAEEKLVQQHRRTPFNPPFLRLQWIDVYGCLPPNMIHIKGLLQLVKLRGGLPNIPTEGLAATISFSDIMSCSVLCVHPCFDFWPLADSRLGWSVQEMLGFGPSDVDQGFGRLQEIGATHQMAEAFQAVHTYIGIIKASLNFTPDTSLLADQRNLTQHTLLSLSPASDISTFFSHPTRAATYEACRLAALIFGVGVLFPIPAQNTPLSTLARLIQAVLFKPSSSELWCSPSTRVPLIWVLTLGGIAANDAPERAWFASALGDVTRRTGLNSWASIKSVLATMLWYEAACDRAAEDLWQEGASKYSYAIQ